MIVVDLDGVVIDSDDFLVKGIEEETGRKVVHTSPRVFRYGIDIPERELCDIIDRTILKYNADMEPFDYGRTLIALLMLEISFGKVTFLTARSECLEEATRWWLDHYFEGLGYDLILLGQGNGKREWMERNGFNSIVEDRFKNANSINFIGGKTYLVNRDWNLGRQELSHVVRVDYFCDAITDYMSSTGRM